MSLFKSIFSSGKDTPAPRELNHPRDLRTGDIIKFGFSAQDELTNQSFRIAKIFTYDISESGQRDQTYLMLEGEGNETLRLNVLNERGTERLEIGRAVFPDQVEQVFNIEAFAHIFDPDSGSNNVLDRIAEPAFLSGWTGETYRQEAANQAYMYQGDYRGRSLPFDKRGEGFDYYRLVSDDRNYAVQMEVFDGGRTDVFLSVLLSASKIEEMFPGEV